MLLASLLSTAENGLSRMTMGAVLYTHLKHELIFHFCFMNMIGDIKHFPKYTYLARQILCLWPPDMRTPLSPTSVSFPSGNISISCWISHASNVLRYLFSLNGLPKRILSFTRMINVLEFATLHCLKTLDSHISNMRMEKDNIL